MRTRFIFNPRSGRNARDPRILERARAFVQAQTLPSDLVFTERPRHASELARQAVADGCELVVAIGGDGTLNEVAAGLVGTGRILGLIPCGSGNGLGRHLGIPDPGRGAFRTLVEGTARTIDTGVVNDIPFFNAMGVGFDAEISHRFNTLTRRGLAAYVRTTMRLFSSYPGLDYTLTGGASPLRGRGFILAVCNSDQYGNDCFIAPGARVDDGVLNLTLLPRPALWAAPLLAWRLFRGTIGRSAGVVLRQDARFLVTRPEPGLVHTDGETHQLGRELDIQVRPKSLRIMCPRVPSTG